MKKVCILFASLLIAVSFIACGDDDSSGDSAAVDPSPPGFADTTSAVLHVTLPDLYHFYQNNTDATTAPDASFAGYTLASDIEYDASTTVAGYSLDQFVTQKAVYDVVVQLNEKLADFDSTDARGLYALTAVSNEDGFSNRFMFEKKGMYNYDLTWDDFIKGYYIPEKIYDARLFFPEDTGVTKMFNNKYAHDIYLFRKIDVQTGDATDSIVAFETAATTDSYVDDSAYDIGTTKFTVVTISFSSNKGDYTDVKAISLDQFITPYVTDSPESFTYNIIAVDGWSREGWTYDNLKQAYFLPELEFICQVDSSTNEQVSQTKIDFPKTIKLVSVTE